VFAIEHPGNAGTEGGRPTPEHSTAAAGGGAAQDGEILLASGPDRAPPAGDDIRLVLPQLLVVRGRLY